MRTAVLSIVCLAAGLSQNALAKGSIPSNGTVFAAALLAPNLGAPTVVPQPRMLLDPLVAARVAHWRCRYEAGRLTELSRRDAEGSLRPMRPPQFEPPAHGYLFSYEDGGVRPAGILAPNGVGYTLRYDREGRVREIACRAPRVRRGFAWTEMRIGYRNGRVASVSYWCGRKPSHDALLVHRKEFNHDARGFMESVSYYDDEGRLRAALTGIARVTFERGPQGEWLSVSYWADAATRTNDWFGVGQYRFTYSSDGRVIESATLDASGAPATNAFGAYRTEWQYDGNGNVIGARAYAQGGVLVYDGRPPMPELFERTLPEAIMQRARDELAPPYWQLADYVELQRASRRWHSRCAAARPAEMAMVAEQGRVLLEYLLQAQGGTLALHAALQAYELGMRDARLLQRAVLSTGVVPHPESRAARTLLGMVLRPMPSNTLFVCGTDIMYLLSLYATSVRGVRADIVPVNQNMLADSTTIEALRAKYGRRVWLPDVADIRAALQQEVERQVAQRAAAGVSKDAGALPARIRGRESVARINMLLLDVLCRSNAMLPVAVEEGYDSTAMYDQLVPRGPLFWYGSSMAECATAHGLITWWSEVARGSKGWAKTEEWEAVRRVLARGCATQGSYWWHKGEEHSATQMFELAMKLCAEEPEAYLRHARLLMSGGRYDEAAQVAGQLRAQLPDDPVALGLAQRCAQASADARELRGVQERLRMGVADVLSNQLRQVELQERLGYDAAARTNAAQLVQLARGRVDILEGLTAYYSRQNDLNALEDCLALLTDAAPGQFSYWVSRAAVAFARRAPDDGVAFLRRAAELDRLRVRRLLSADNLLIELRASGQTNLVQELLQMIAP